MKCSKILALVLVLFCVMLPLAGVAAEAPTEVQPQKDAIYVRAGKTAAIHLTITPRAARNAGVTYESDNEEVATVTSHGVVNGIGNGTCQITITSKHDPSVTATVSVSVITWGKKMQLTAEKPSVLVGETLQLSPVFEPAETSVQQASYKSSNTHIATVDENGLVTGVKAGKVTITATAIDGSRIHAKANVQVVQSVEAVDFPTPRVRVGVNYHGTFTASLQPKNATNHNMTWTSEDTSIATVSGSKNSVRIQGHAWGQTQITGVTEDGGYEVQFIADIGSLRHAIDVRHLTLHDGKPHITLENVSNLNITEVRYQIKGYDSKGNQVAMSRNDATLYGTYDHDLAPGESTTHGEFHFSHPIDYDIDYYELAITGITTDTGYYDRNGVEHNNFNLAESNFDWKTSDN